MHPVAPPTKKQRSSREASQGKDALSTAADDAIARRRAELHRLQQMRSTQQGALLDQARTQLGAPPMPASGPIARARHSDIFPSVTKMGVVAAVPPPPERPTSMDSRIPTPRVARRLDPAFQEKRERARSAPPMRPPPPVQRPPPLVAEAPTPKQPPPSSSASFRPSPITPNAMQESSPQKESNSPSTARRDILRNLREYADTPPVTKQSEDIRLVKELKQAQDEKADALRKVARLREQIHQLQTQEPSSLEVVVQVAEQSGETAAIQWAREQVSNNPQQPPVSQVRMHMISFIYCAT